MLLRNLGIRDPQLALNKEIFLWDHAKGPIVGVLKDFNTRSFRDDLAPLNYYEFQKRLFRSVHKTGFKRFDGIHVPH